MAIRRLRLFGQDSSFSGMELDESSGARRLQLINLNQAQREAILSAIAKTVRTKFFDPNLNGVDWDAEVEMRRETILNPMTWTSSRSQ